MVVLGKSVLRVKGCWWSKVARQMVLEKEATSRSVLLCGCVCVLERTRSRFGERDWHLNRKLGFNGGGGWLTGCDAESAGLGCRCPAMGPATMASGDQEQERTGKHCIG
ncbi:hypothetical protein L1887_06867 [Cichorium endivia]|nr:hypothetical protein L1887_06867 [Cichorium endivia]